MITAMKSILSIQSSVTLGAVGNTMAAAVMAASAHLLCRVDTIQLTAHPGHGFRAGGSISNDDFSAVIMGIERLNGWDGLDAIMTGYIGHVGQIAAIEDALSRFDGSGRPVLVDPAFGDHGRLYCDEPLARAIAEQLIPRAKLITPNAFELGWLTDGHIVALDDAAHAASVLFDRHPMLEAVAATGIATGVEGEIADTLHLRGDHLAAGDSISDPGSVKVFRKDALNTISGNTGSGNPISGNAMAGGFSGGGDLFTALAMKGLMDGLGITDAVRDASRLSGLIFSETQRLGRKDIALEAIRPVIANPEISAGPTSVS